MENGQTATGIRWRRIVIIVCVITLLIAANLVARNYIDVLSFPIRPGNEDAVHRTIMISATLYAIMLAVPFVPGAEIGVALMAMLGPQIALLVYLCTLAGLSLSFILGRLIPVKALINMAKDLKLERTRQLLQDIEPLDKKERLDLLINRAPKRMVPLLLRYRYFALAAALNTPGNWRYRTFCRCQSAFFGDRIFRNGHPGCFSGPNSGHDFWCGYSIGLIEK
jgi:hypothetical protein